MSRCPTSAQTVHGETIRGDCLRLRVKGLTYDEIGRELGVNPKTAMRHVQKGLAKLRQQNLELSAELLALEVARTEGIHAAMQPGVEQGDPQSAAVQLRGVEIRAKMIGLNAPEKHEHAQASEQTASEQMGAADLFLALAQRLHDTGTDPRALLEMWTPSVPALPEHVDG